MCMEEPAEPWGGQSRPLDPIVFEKRPGFPGWPITRQDLDPYYKKAVALNRVYGLLEQMALISPLVAGHMKSKSKACRPQSPISKILILKCTNLLAMTGSILPPAPLMEKPSEIPPSV